MNIASTMSLRDALYSRRSVRSYRAETLDKKTIEQLLDAAIHAPTAVHEEPWQFIVIQDRALLKRLSDHAKEIVIDEANKSPSVPGKHLPGLVSDSNFNIFYDAGTLIALAVKPAGGFETADAWLAAENLMLAACAMGLGTCVIGFSVSVLNTPEVKRELGIPSDLSIIAPIIVGKPLGETPASPRKKAEILVWK